MHICKNCNKENSDRAKYCKSCGKSLGFVCPECQHENDMDAKFCEECGLNLENHIQKAEIASSFLLSSTNSQIENFAKTNEEKYSLDLESNSMPIDINTGRPLGGQSESLYKSEKEKVNETVSEKNNGGEFILYFIIFIVVYGFIMSQILQGKITDPNLLMIISVVAFSIGSILFYFWYKVITRLHWFAKLAISLGSAFILNNLIGFICGLLIGFNAGFGQGFLGAINQPVQLNPISLLVTTNTPSPTPLPSYTPYRTPEITKCDPRLLGDWKHYSSVSRADSIFSFKPDKTIIWKYYSSPESKVLRIEYGKYECRGSDEVFIEMDGGRTDRLIFQGESIWWSYWGHYKNQ